MSDDQNNGYKQHPLFKEYMNRTDIREQSKIEDISNATIHLITQEELDVSEFFLANEELWLSEKTEFLKASDENIKILPELAETWARLMQNVLSIGQDLDREFVQTALNEASFHVCEDDATEFMKAAAGGMLIRSWQHGEKLRNAIYPAITDTLF